MTTDIENKRKEKLGEHYKNSEMMGKIQDVIHEHDGKVSVPECLGILELMKMQIYLNAIDGE